jgi:hypothetical protein
MNLKVIRYSSQSDSTLGVFYIDNKFQCYTLEDEFRDIKLKHETRIPDGTYRIGLRTEGGFHNRYKNHRKPQIKDMHKGMLQVQDVPNFEYILIHCGNTDDDTSGCLLLGNSANNNKVVNGFIGDSVSAYVSAYKKIIEAIDKGEPVSITYTSIEEND